MVPTLSGVIRSSPADLSREAARARAHIGGPAAVAALEESLASLDPGVREVAAYSLGAIGGSDAVRALLGVLDDNGFGGQRSPALARVAIRELAALGSDAAVPKLVSILERRSLFHRRDQRELKLAALGALARLHAGEARRAILRAVRSRDPEIRRRAQQIAEQLQRADGVDAAAGARTTKG
jgi:HEAT repeat protein